MTDRFGTCRNQDYCSLALQRTVLRLGPDELFVCPECARPLSAASAWKKGGAGRVALLRLAPPLGIVAIGLGAIWLGIQHPDAPRVSKTVTASLEPAAPSKAAPRRPPPAIRIVAKPAPLRTVVLLRTGAAPPLNQLLLPQLAAGYLAQSYRGLPVLGAVDDIGHVVLTAGGRILDVMVTPATFDVAAFASGQTDVLCTPEEPIASQLQAAGPLIQVPLGDMKAPSTDRIMCYGRPGGDAAAFLDFVGSQAGRQIVASAGYDFQPVPQPPPPVPVPAPVAVPVTPMPPMVVARPVAKPGAKSASKFVPKAGAAKLAAGTTTVAKAAKPKAAALSAEPKPDSAPRSDDTDTDKAAEAAPGPRRVVVPPGSPLTLEAVKALTTPDTAGSQGQGDAPHPRTVYLPASARLSFGTYQPVKMPEQTPRMVFVKPEAAIRPGSLKADCNIGVDGVPSDCREITHQGTTEAAAAIMAWLPSGGIRYIPVVKDGHTVQERRVITVTFGGKAAPK
jgi:hypothetical protein